VLAASIFLLVAQSLVKSTPGVKLTNLLAQSTNASAHTVTVHSCFISIIPCAKQLCSGTKYEIQFTTVYLPTKLCQTYSVHTTRNIEAHLNMTFLLFGACIFVLELENF